MTTWPCPKCQSLVVSAKVCPACLTRIPLEYCAGFQGGGTLVPVLNPDGTARRERWGLLWYIPIFTFTNDKKKPLTFTDYDGTQYQPDNHFQTDGGSIPPFLQSIPGLQLSPWAAPRAYPMHDSAFKYGGLYVRRTAGARFKFTLLSRNFLDGLLRRMVLADTGSSISAKAVRLGVYCGSRFAWNPDRQKRNRIDAGIVV